MAVFTTTFGIKPEVAEKKGKISICKNLRVKQVLGDRRVCAPTFRVCLREVGEDTAGRSRGLDEITSEDGNSSDKLAGGGVFLHHKSVRTISSIKM